MYKHLILIIFIPLTLWGAEKTEFEKFLEKNSTYKSLTEKLESAPAADPHVKEGFNTVHRALELYIEEKRNPAQPSKAELLKEAQVDMQGCPTCQSYLNLSGDINKILKKMDKGTDIGAANEATLQLNHLNFLYYVVKYENSNGGVQCNKYGNFEKINNSRFGGSFQLVAEELFDLPNVNEVQYIPQNGKEVVYLYRGTGAHKNSIIEVHILPDGKALLKYYDYTPSSAERLTQKNNSPLDAALTTILKPKEEKPKGDNFIQLGLDVKTKDIIVPTDLEVMKAQSKTDLTSDLVLGTKTNLSFNEQKTEVVLSNKAGEPWIQVNAAHKTEGRGEFTTILPLSMELHSDSQLGIKGNVKSEVGLKIATREIEQAHTVNLGLTDHNHKYINFEVYHKPEENYSKVTVSNNYNLGALGDIGMNYSQDSKGDRKYSIGKNTNLGNFGTLKTEFGSGSSSKPFIALQHEVAIGKSSTLSIGAKAESGAQVTTMFQFKSKF